MGRYLVMGHSKSTDVALFHSKSSPMTRGFMNKIFCFMSRSTKPIAINKRPNRFGCQAHEDSWKCSRDGNLTKCDVLGSTSENPEVSDLYQNLAVSIEMIDHTLTSQDPHKVTDGSFTFQWQPLKLNLNLVFESLTIFTYPLKSANECQDFQTQFRQEKSPH
jgi:hypothetical protein